MMPVANIGIVARDVGLASSIIPSMSRRRLTNVQPKQCISVIEQYFSWSFVSGGSTREYGPQNWSVLVIA